MIHHLEKTVIHASFEVVIEQLVKELGNQGFECGDVVDFQKINSPSEDAPGRKYVILSAYMPPLYRDMLLYAPFPGRVLPCMISLVEINTNTVEIFPCNTTEAMIQGIENPRLQNFASEVGHRLVLAVSALEKLQVKNPDLVTSWS
jgi:uncharacterized protein (DUF302 family)